MDSALKFVVLVGVVSLFADMTYEGTRSINGQYLALAEGRSRHVVPENSGRIRRVSSYAPCHVIIVK
jgi:hypothetical protein